LSCAAVAAPPSPSEPASPFPAIAAKLELVLAEEAALLRAAEAEANSNTRFGRSGAVR